MAEFDQVLDDFGDSVSDGFDNLKKFVKEKPFMLAVGATVLVALFVAWRKSQAQVETTDEVATFYTYPTTGGGASATFQGESVANSMYYDLLAEMQNKDAEHQEAMSDLKSEYGAQFSEMESVVTELTASSKQLADQVTENQNALYRQKKLDQMKANSDLYILTDDPTLRDALHQENLGIADELGLVFDGKGSYTDPNLGGTAYVTQLQSFARNQNNTPKSGTMTSNATYQGQVLKAVEKVTYDPNVNYAAEIKKAKESGASQDVINNLTAQREAKIQAEYGGVDPGVGDNYNPNAKKTTK